MEHSFFSKKPLSLFTSYYVNKSWSVPFRPGSYVAFLPCRIQFNELNSTEIRRLNRLPHFCRTFDWSCRIIRQKCDTDSESNFCRVESNAYIIVMYWACVNVFPSKKKRKLGHSRPNATWTCCNTYCAVVSLLLLVPLAVNFSQN